MSFLAVGIGLSVAGSYISARSAHKQQEENEIKETQARQEMERLRGIYQNLDTSNPYEGLQNRYADMDNVFEDMTVDQRAAEFQKQQFQQSQANILQGMRGAAGASGIAGVAQALANQGQTASQQSAINIGQQERQNQMQQMGYQGTLNMAEARGGASIDQLRAQGQRESQRMEFDKQGTLLGMAQSETAAYADRAALAQQAKMDAISQGFSSVGSFFGA